MQSKYKAIMALGLLAPAIFFMLPSHKSCLPEKRDIAITIDDLPFDNHYFQKMVDSLRAHKAPAIGFVIANRVNDEFKPQLEQFQRDGFQIGSHTYSHLRLSKTSADAYIDDIQRADDVLTPFMTVPKYFRYPHLSKGQWWKSKKVIDYLTKNHYIVAPVTIDSKDFKFNVELLTSKERDNPDFLNQLKQRYFDFVWKQTLKAEHKQRCTPTKQILLLHANQLNSYFLNDLLRMYEQKGVHFITLDDALWKEGRGLNG